MCLEAVEIRLAVTFQRNRHDDLGNVDDLGQSKVGMVPADQSRVLHPGEARPARSRRKPDQLRQLGLAELAMLLQRTKDTDVSGVEGGRFHSIRTFINSHPRESRCPTADDGNIYSWSGGIANWPQAALAAQAVT